jgi:lysyl-tRNA synthetase class 2
MQTWQKIKNNPELQQKYFVRAKVISAIREFFVKQGFLEVETPLLVENPGTEPFLEVFKTSLDSPDYQSRPGFLTTSPELQMKKLLAAGFGNIFQICKSFRNQEGMSDKHNPEFTILEWYRVDADYADIMRDCEQLFLSIFRSIYLNRTELLLPYQSKNYNLQTPWERISVSQAFEKYLKIDVETMLSESELSKIAAARGYSVGPNTSWEEVFHQLLLNEIEPYLGQVGPTILYDYPASQAALSKKKAEDPRFAERFEIFLAGAEIGNAFSELTDWQEQEARMMEDLSQRQKLGKEEYQIDQQFIEALKQGLPPTGGIAIGVDRLVMLFANVKSIKEILFFPVEDVFKVQ